MRKHFCTKQIREWLDDNEQKMYFPNWDTYSFFQQQEIKRAFHQSASGLFICAIFIDYLSNITSRQFMKMLAVFYRK